MKQVVNKTKMATMGLFTLCAMGLSNQSFAGIKTTHPTDNNPTELKFIGKTNNEISIQLDLNNVEPGDYFVNVKTVNHHILYSAIMKGTNLSKIFRLNADQDGTGDTAFSVRVEVTSETTHTTQVYIITSPKNSDGNVIVAKL